MFVRVNVQRETYEKIVCLYIYTYFQQECFYISKLYEILLCKNVILYETLIHIYYL